MAVIGGGPAGLSAAYEMGKRNRGMLVLEADSQLGGLSRTVRYKGFGFDIGGHRFFTKNQQVNHLWHEVLGDEFLRRPRLSRIYYRQRFFSYPLQIGNALAGLGPLTSAHVIGSFLWHKALPAGEQKTFEQWVTKRFGRALYRIFFKTYTEKVWGIPCTELSADWAAQRIRNLSLGRAVLNAMGLGKGAKVASLIDEFEYPRLGPGQMYETMAAKAQDMGARIEMNTRVLEVRHDGRRIAGVLVSRDGRAETIDVGSLMSSMPLSELVLAMRPLPPDDVVRAARSLAYRSIITVNLIIDQPQVVPDTWIYIHAPDVAAGRMQLYKNWSPSMVPDPSKSAIGMEYFASEGDAMWSLSDAQLMELGKADLQKLRLVPAAAVQDGFVFRYPKAYPVYAGDYASALAKIRDFLAPIENLVCVGRYGQFRYNNMDHSILTALLGVRRLLGEPVDPWSVNEEAEYHEERKSN
jgi:protoporphyrinogen oxidase